MQYFAAFPRVTLGLWPTPLHKLQRLGLEAGHEELYIKRDDLSGIGLGGNKTRSLEFLLGDALAQGADVIITAGGLQSNLCALTAAACCKIGIDCILVHNDDKPERLEGNMLLNHIFGAHAVFLGKTDEGTRTLEMEHLAQGLRSQGRKPYIIHNGASTPLGSLGYANAAFELHDQCREKGLNIEHVGMVGAMGGTASGFVLGNALLGNPFQVHIISVEYPKGVLERIISDITYEGYKLISERCSADLALPRLTTNFTIYEEYLGEGYAMPTLLSRETLYKVPRKEGILLEDVYTSKTVGGFLDLIKRGIISPNEGACYIHTGGLGSLFAQDILGTKP
jgi:1-aminocyclopropane-1-carboxylate deaminase/D-cysteine desulfhydrase/L-cysteate sulfo-lyase